MDIRKTLLWAIFTISALLLFNAWQEQTGQGSLFSKSAAPAKEQVIATSNGAKDLPKPVETLWLRRCNQAPRERASS